MIIFIDSDAGLRSRWGRVVPALLGFVLCLAATEATADGNATQTTVDHLERFDFTGTYRLSLAPATNSPKPSAPAAHPLMVATTDESIVADTAKPANVLRAGVIDATTKKKRTGVDGDRVKTASVSREARSVPGGPNAHPQEHPFSHPLMRAAVTSTTTPQDHPAAAPPQARPLPPAISAQVLHADRPTVHMALSTREVAANAEEPATPQTAAAALTGRIIDVPPLPELYDRPASQSRIRSYRPRHTARRRSKSKPARSAKAKPTPAGVPQNTWVNKALFSTN